MHLYAKYFEILMKSVITFARYMKHKGTIIINKFVQRSSYKKPMSLIGLLSICSTYFSQKLLGQSKSYIHIEHPSDESIKIWLYSAGHTTKMAAVHMLGKNLLNSLFFRTKWAICHWVLACIIGDVGHTEYV